VYDKSKLVSTASQQRTIRSIGVPNESHSEQLRRESNELLETAAKLIEHAETLKAQAAELQKQVARLDRSVKQKKADQPTIQDSSRLQSRSNR
jgi:DNA-binding transcriptional MerR regulator